ncbi:hypothetical protein GCM10023172_33070 [Hymenobacter ginsengisoli]|uniref:Bacterial Pleckstrin homology domain-containing protein n=1 Tax=Hymenobacter ginsengisoli TaxID=1051626 RepID=A0ABP8QLU8_9BACT|nr:MULTISPECIES: hypothetical protein [unclassified Hymenobacter]MBO2031155.1 hypothetical protein [Hymenobacter sp. BT559]
MVVVHSEGDTVVFTVEGWHKLWAFRSELRIPRANIKSARHDPEAAHTWGFRAPGTHIPGLLKAGTFYLVGSVDNKPAFLDVQHQENTVVVELTDEHFARLIIEVENPDAVVAQLNELAAAPS